ncbi:spore photoproduct lyase [Thermotalea metallivorans]|uniref:Spore photoproduct lyase n=1 Tax=Thermotalea metallivorans TaxID=520762 RepID=A0A140L7F1_9FIRM|nr:spore photoproduct lyase [Thermotalea metallivorans]KXG76476.1 Spore photoproduct lyase [Thermotalea metallivorans]
MKLWMPDRVYFEPAALEFPMGERIYKFCMEHDIPILKTTSHHQVRNIPGDTDREKFSNAKKTLVVGTKKSLSLDVCKPSAHYQFSLVTNCPGNCEYCYLFTTQGKRPYVRVYVNIEEIFQTIRQYIENRLPETTVFEAASTGDPLGVEHITGALRDTIEHFGTLEKGKLRVVTKFSNVDSLLDAKHQGNTRFRFSVNSQYVVDQFEHNTHPLEERLKAAEKMGKAGYPLGFIIAPILLHEKWREGYKKLMEELRQHLNFAGREAITFELIQHRFTRNAKEIIRKRYPNTKLDMDEGKRVLKFGKYGRAKYVYPKDVAEEMKEYLSELIMQYFPNGHIEYFT